MVGVGNIASVITNQYPHHLYKRVSVEATQNEDGSWEDGSTEATVLYCGTCREETNGKGSKIQAANGVFREFSTLAQLPVSVERVDEGTTVFITSEQIATPTDLLDSDFVEQAKADGTVRIVGECLKFDSGRLHNRLWV